jgi:ectoine hydroxylase-related dioxygenase (phytanoyl-CoA dioxygenase family)
MKATPTADIAEAKRDLDRLGYCLVDKALSPAETKHYRDHLEAATGPSGKLMNLIGHDEAFLELAQHPVALDFADYQLGPDFLLSGSNGGIQRPGAEAQRLHSDQAYVPPPWAYPTTMNIIWLLDDFTDANGGTRLIPGSHLWNVSTARGIRTFEQWLDDPVFITEDGKEHAAGPPRPPIAVEAPAGTALVMDGRIWHQAGPNSTTDQHRHGAQTYFCRPHIRQQTLFLLSLPKALLDRARTSPLLSRLFGFDLYYRVIGVIDPPVN